MAITLTFTEEEWKAILEAEGNEMADFPEIVRDRIIKALCPDGHKEENIWSYEHKAVYNWQRPNIEYNADCVKCGTALWRISDNKDYYTYINWVDDGWPGIKFQPGDENDPKKVVLDGKGTT
jgi:hypothetical protein